MEFVGCGSTLFRLEVSMVRQLDITEDEVKGWLQAFL
jgi:hypothetical protein